MKERRAGILAGVGLALLATGCGDAINCELYGDNVVGRINFTDSSPLEINKNLVVEFSTNSFGSVASRHTVRNRQELLSVPFSHCVSTGSSYSFRAYQDSNGNDSYDAGEANGRHDGTANGHASHLSRFIATIPDGELDADTWVRLSAIDIDLDNTAAQ